MDIKKIKFDKIYPLYLAKAERKERTRSEVNEVIYWLTGYNNDQLASKIEESVDLESFFSTAPNLNPKRVLIKGSICGVKIDEIDDQLVKEIRYLDKLIDELAKGKSIDKILNRGYPH